MAGELTLPKSIKEHCDLMIEDSQRKLNYPYYVGDEYLDSYDDGYHQGRKDALRVILLVLKDFE